MPTWQSQVNPVFVSGVTNRYMVEGGIEAFDIFPNLPVKSKTGYIADYNKADWLKIGAVADYIVAGAVETMGDSYGIGKLPYLVKKFGFHKDVTEDEANEYDTPITPVSDAALFVVNRLKRVLLLNLIQSFLTTGVWTYDLDQTAAKWNVKVAGVSSTDIVSLIKAQKLAMGKTTGFIPNKMIVTPDVDDAIKGNTFVTGALSITRDKVVTDDMVKMLLDLKEYKVVTAVNSGGTDWIATKLGLLAYTPAKPSRNEPSAGYNITSLAGRGSTMVETRTIPMPHLNNSLRIEGNIYNCPLKVAGDLGALFYNCI